MRATKKRTETKMQRNVLLAALIGTSITILANQTFAQSPEQNPVRQQAVQAARYGAALGLPRDGGKLYLPDEAYPRFPLPPGNAAYAHVDGLKMKEVVEQIATISRRSRDDGNQYWGRIAGTPYDRMTEDWVAEQFRAIGLQNVRRQELDMKPLWYPESWKADVAVAGATTVLKSPFPINGTVGTAAAGITAPAVWVGLGTAADLKGRDIKDKAVFIYSIATPGGRDHSAAWNGAIRRVNEGGAALVFVIMGFPGNAVSNPEGADGTRAPTFTISVDEGNMIREALEKGQDVSVRLQPDIKPRYGLTTDHVRGVRRRTITSLTTSDHHHGSIGVRWVHDHMDEFFAKTAVIVNCEHPSQTLMYLLNAGIMTANEVSARRWYVGGSDALKRLVTGTFKEFGVSVYTAPEQRPGGELSQLFDKAPSFHIIDHVIYHTTIATSQLVPAWAMVAATRAFLKIIDAATKISLPQVRSGGT